MYTSFHDEAELWAAAAVTGGLNDTELKAWSEHLAACPACKKLHDENLAMGNLLKTSLDPESPDPGFEQRIIGRLNQTRVGKGNRWYEFLLFHPPLGAAAAGLALGALLTAGWFIHREKSVSIGSAVIAESGKLPDAVLSAIQRQAKGRTVVHIQRNDGAGPVSYTITAKAQESGEADFTVSEDGTLLSSDTTLAAMPAAVRKAINAQVGPGKLGGLEENIEDGRTMYVATIVAPEGGTRDYTFNGDGTLASMETPLAELPEPVAAAVKAQAAQGKIDGIDKTFENGETTYTAGVVTSDGRQRDFTFREDGSLAAMEIDLADTPGAVRNAIEAQVGKGRLGGVDKSFDKGKVAYLATIAGPGGRWREMSFTEQGKPHRPPPHHHRRWHRHHPHRRPNPPPPHRPAPPGIKTTNPPSVTI